VDGNNKLDADGPKDAKSLSKRLKVDCVNELRRKNFGTKYTRLFHGDEVNISIELGAEVIRAEYQSLQSD